MMRAAILAACFSSLAILPVGAQTDRSRDQGTPSAGAGAATGTSPIARCEANNSVGSAGSKSAADCPRGANMSTTDDMGSQNGRGTGQSNQTGAPNSGRR